MIEIFITETFNFIDKTMFSPLVLIGLFITSLSLVLNLKESNVYIRNFKKHSNIIYFIDKIFQTIKILLLIFCLSFIVQYIPLIKPFTTIEQVIYLGISIVYVFLIAWIVLNLFSISYMLKEIAKTSLRDDKE